MFVTACADAGVDMFDCSATEWWVPEFLDRHPTRSLAGWTQALSGKPACCGGSVGLNLPTGPTPSAVDDVADAEARFDDSCLMRLEELNARMEEGEIDLCFVGRALIADAEWCTKVRDGRLGELAPYNRGSLLRFAEGNHPVPAAEFAKVVRPVDIDGKPLRPGAAPWPGQRVFYPTSVPEALWHAHFNNKVSAMTGAYGARL